MLAWRISKAKRAGDLSGRGAALEGGRWNDIDVPAVYMGLTASICALETFVHATGRPKVPLKIARYCLPDDPKLYFTPEPKNLPDGWQTVPADRPSMAYGTQWLLESKQLGLIIPSVVLPLERNIVLNPSHPAIKDIVLEEMFAFSYDERMFRTRQDTEAR